MKKLLFVSFALLSVPMIHTSCGVTNSISQSIKTIQMVNDIAGTAKNISSVLSNTLGLDNAQKSSMTGVITDYITGTNGIHGLASTDISQYAKKLGSLNTNTLGKLKGIMTAAQYAKMLGLGGSSKSSDSFLKNLVGGESLTPSAMSVLSGLLL